MFEQASGVGVSRAGVLHMCKCEVPNRSSNRVDTCSAVDGASNTSSKVCITRCRLSSGSGTEHRALARRDKISTTMQAVSTR